MFLQIPYYWIFFYAAKAQFEARMLHALRLWITHTHSIVLLSKDDQLVAEAATYTTQNKHNRRISTPSAGFETEISIMERLKTYALDRRATTDGPHPPCASTLFVCISNKYIKEKCILKKNYEPVQLQCINPYPTAFPCGNGMVLHFYQQQESSTTKTVHKVINKGLKTYV